MRATPRPDQKEEVMRRPRAAIAVLALSIATIDSGAITAVAFENSRAVAAPSAELTSGHLPPARPLVLVSRQSGATIRSAIAVVGKKSEAILVDSQGYPLYFYEPDTSTKSMVAGQLAVLWPPVLDRSPTITGAGGSLKVVDTRNGPQVSYNGHFLYTFAQDRPGHATGQGVENFFVATPKISPNRVTSSADKNATGSGHGSSRGYGY
jgi:predicted lipoprotein with Yx(FWY)xxD motif